MPMQQLEQYLRDHEVPFTTIAHSRAYTAQEVAAEAHIPGREVAKTVMVELDGSLAMAVVPAPYRVNLSALAEATGADKVEVVPEKRFRDRFPECEVGAMPPFGNLWDMTVFVDRRLREDERIAFNAGTHTELFEIAYEDFEELVEPVVVDIGIHEQAV